MNSILKWLRGAGGVEKDIHSLRRQFTALDYKVDKAADRVVVDEKRVESQVAAVQKKIESLQKETDLLLNEISNLRKTNRILTETLDAVREELRTAHEITIPGLVQANQVMLARWEAETQIQVARAVLLRTKEE